MRLLLWPGSGLPVDHGATWHWQQHAHLLAIAAILLAEELDQIALFKLNSDQDVAGGRDGEQEVASRHRRRRPEGKQEAQVNGMTDMAIKGRCVEFGFWQMPFQTCGRKPA